MAALYLQPESPVNPHTFLGALGLVAAGAARPLIDLAGCATGWGCGGLRADANPINWAKGIAGTVASLASDIAHGHFGGAAGTIAGLIAVGGGDPAGDLSPRAITAAPERLALPAGPSRLAISPARPATVAAGADVASPINSAFMWTGMSELQASTVAEAMGGTTLEAWLRNQGVTMPPFVRGDLTSEEAWQLISARWAANASGVVRVLVGPGGMRSDSVFNTIERPVLEVNPLVTRIIYINVKS